MLRIRAEGDVVNIDLFKQRFIHRSDVFSYQFFSKDEKGERFGYARATAGDCPEQPPCPKKTCKHIWNVPLTNKQITLHLEGKMTLATYALAEDNTVRWMCLDVDITKARPDRPQIDPEIARKRAQEHTITLAKRLNKVLGPNKILVEDSGSKGYHLWVFFSEPVQARYVLSFGEWLVQQATPPEGIHVEIYPKQQEAKNLGNMVKLPMGIHKRSGRRCEFVDGTFTPYEDQWKKLASVQTLTANDLQIIIQRNGVQLVHSIQTYRGETPDGSLPCMVRIMDEGLVEGTRDHGIFALSIYLKDKGLPTWATQGICNTVNERSGDPLHADVIETKILSAYEGDYSIFPCNNDVLDGYCTSHCRFWTTKVRRRWPGVDPVTAVGRLSRD
jgi:hypothetical protein